MQFVPLWDSILDSRKLSQLSLETIGKWCLLLLSARRHDWENGFLPPVADIAFWTRRSESEIQGWIAELVEVKLLDRHGKTLAIHDWEQWKCKSARTSTARVAKFRERKRKERETLHETPGNNGATLHVTKVELVTCNEEEKRRLKKPSLLSPTPENERPSDASRAGESGGLGAPSVGFPLPEPEPTPEVTKEGIVQVYIAKGFTEARARKMAGLETQ